MHGESFYSRLLEVITENYQTILKTLHKNMQQKDVK